MLKPEGILIIYESCQQQENVYSIFDERVSSLKVSGFKVKAQESLDTKQLKNLLLNIYNNIDNIFEIIAEKPSFEVSYIFFFINFFKQFNIVLFRQFLYLYLLYLQFIQIGSSVTLNFGEKKSNIWKLDNAVDEELINEDDLLDESDIVKPIINSLRGKLNSK